MPDLNKTNRAVCDVDIRDKKTKEPILFFNSANLTTQNISSDSSFAKSKGINKISFQNPLEGTITIEAQIYPFKLYQLLTNGIIDSVACYPKRQKIKCVKDGKLEITDNAIIGTVFVFKQSLFGKTEIGGTFDGNTFTSTNLYDIRKNEYYEVGYVVNKLKGVRKISFNNNNLPKSYYISMNTVEKDENGVYTPYKIILYKAFIQRKFELTQSNEGQPASFKLTFTLLHDEDNKLIDMIEINDEQYDDSLNHGFSTSSEGTLIPIDPTNTPVVNGIGLLIFRTKPYVNSDGVLILNG